MAWNPLWYRAHFEASKCQGRPESMDLFVVDSWLNSDTWNGFGVLNLRVSFRVSISYCWEVFAASSHRQSVVSAANSNEKSCVVVAMSWLKGRNVVVLGLMLCLALLGVLIRPKVDENPSASRKPKRTSSASMKSRYVQSNTFLVKKSSELRSIVVPTPSMTYNFILNQSTETWENRTTSWSHCFSHV